METRDVIGDLANKAYGIYKADSWVARNIVDLVFSHDKETGLVTLVASSPSTIPIPYNEAEHVGEVFSYVAAMLEEPVFAVFSHLLPYDTCDPGVADCYISVAKDFCPKDYVISEDRMIVQNDFFIPMKITGLTSLEQFALPYLKEVKDAAQSSTSTSTGLSGIISLLQKLDSTPSEMLAMFQLEYGPYDQAFWMAYASMAEHDSKRDIELTKTYVPAAVERYLVVESPYDVRTVTYAIKEIEKLAEDARPELEKYEVDLTKDEVIKR
jgi:hypothetical protein